VERETKEGGKPFKNLNGRPQLFGLVSDTIKENWAAKSGIWEWLGMGGSGGEATGKKKTPVA